jgi:hypothetical protein
MLKPQPQLIRWPWSARRTQPPHADSAASQQLVVAAPKVLDEPMPGDDDPGARFLLAPSHRSQARLQPAVIRLDPVVSLAVGAVPCRWQQLLHEGRIHRRLIGGDLDGYDLGRRRWPAPRKRRAALASRRLETNTSTTWPNWSMAALLHLPITKALLQLVSLRHREAVTRSGVRSPRQARRTRRPSAELLAPRPQARSGLVADSGRSHARRSRSWRCGPA